jgi:hypothetical protein
MIIKNPSKEIFMVKKKIQMRIADMLGDPDLMRKAGLTLEKYQQMVKQYGLDKARATRMTVEVDVIE